MRICCVVCSLKEVRVGARIVDLFSLHLCTASMYERFSVQSEPTRLSSDKVLALLSS